MPKGGARVGAGRPPGATQLRARDALTIVQRYVRPADWKTLVAKLLELANAGDVEAIKLLLSYQDGRPSQRIEHSGPAGGPISVEYQDPLDELVTLLARGDESGSNPEPIN